MELAEAVVLEVKDSGDVQGRLTRVQRAMALNVTGHTIDNMRHGHAGVGVISVVVDDRGRINVAGLSKGPETLIPMNVTKGVRKVSAGEEYYQDKRQYDEDEDERGRIAKHKEAYPERYTSTPYWSKSSSKAARTSAW
jgi:hypothetical protein